MNKNTKRARKEGLTTMPVKQAVKGNGKYTHGPTHCRNDVQEILKGNIKTSFPENGKDKKKVYPDKKRLKRLQQGE